MGIVNLTDDSFFEKSRCPDVESAVSRVAAMVSEGADIVDIGACSTRPGSVQVGPEEEWRRLEPVLTSVREAFPKLRISVDTVWAEVVAKTYALIGDFIVNDISAGEDDPEMLPLVGRLGLEYIAMHKKGNPDTMQSMTDYEDVTEEVLSYFERFAERARKHRISGWILDPGFGFAKTIEQNYILLASLSRFSDINPRILVGISRKSMIYKKFGITPEESLPATQVLHFHALSNGAAILRVHDVAEAVRTRDIYLLL